MNKFIIINNKKSNHYGWIFLFYSMDSFSVCASESLFFVGLLALGNFTLTLNKSPSISIKKIPPCNSVKLLAIERPSPLPSDVLELSPLTNRSVISSALMLSQSLKV
jgi:hypothetical protein